MKTYMASPSTIERKWYVVDAEGQTLGRLAAQTAAVLRGKNKPTFTPHMDTGDYVIIVNAEKIKVTGKKMEQKTYFSHSKYVGGVRETGLREMLSKNRDTEALILEGSIQDNITLPSEKDLAKKLFIYAGPEHKHQAQKPEVLTF